jgi:hypothetical protein
MRDLNHGLDQIPPEEVGSGITRDMERQWRVLQGLQVGRFFFFREGGSHPRSRPPPAEAAGVERVPWPLGLSPLQGLGEAAKRTKGIRHVLGRLA